MKEFEKLIHVESIKCFEKHEHNILIDAFREVIYNRINKSEFSICIQSSYEGQDYSEQKKTIRIELREKL